MKLKTLKMYQPVPVGKMGKLEAFLDIGNQQTVPGLQLSFEQGLARIEATGMPVRLVPSANIMYMEPLLEEPSKKK